MTGVRTWARQAVLGCAAATVAVLLAACGSTSSTQQTPAPGGEPIKIGLAVARTGFSSIQASPAADTALAWATWVNANGGIDGRPVQILAEDTAATPTTAQAVARKLVETDGVVAMMTADPAAESSINPYLEQRNVPVVGAMSFDKNSWGARPNFFSTSSANTTMQQSYVTSAASVGAKSMGVAVCAEAATCQQTAGVVEKVAADLGIADNGAAKVAASQPSFTAECLNFLDKKTEFIALGVSFADVGVRMAADCQQQGYTGSFAVVSVSVIKKFLDEAPSGTKFVGGMPAFPWWADAPPVAQFRDAMEKYAPGFDYAGTFATGTWASLELFRKAVTGKAAGLDRQKVMDAYYALKDEALGGLLPQAMTYTRGQAAPIVRCYWLYNHESGTDAWTLSQSGRNGNGATGDLASSCYDGPAG